jgi:LPS O-antigen subunit length determinant protein (WzzB/FepE family)
MPDDLDPSYSRRLQRLEQLLDDAAQDDVVDLRALFVTLWRRKWLISIVTACFAVASVAFALWLPNQYKSTVILMPASTSEGLATGQARATGALCCKAPGRD